MNALTLSVITVIIVIIALLGIIVIVNQLDESMYSESERYQALESKVSGMGNEAPRSYTEATAALQKQINYDFGRMLDILEDTNRRLSEVEHCFSLLVFNVVANETAPEEGATEEKKCHDV